MRRVLLIGTLFVLLIMTWAIWAFRFERVEGLAAWHLKDLRQSLMPTAGVAWTGSPDDPTLRLTVIRGNPTVAIRIAIPGMVPVDGLHLRFRMSSERLIQGTETWQNGRFIIEWNSVEDPRQVQRDSAGSTKEDWRGEMESLVIQSPAGAWVPTLRLEHLGQSGNFELADLELTAVEESPVWIVGRWILALGWLGWAAVCIRSWPGISWRRATAAAAIWVVLGANFVIPGPWKVQRPLISEFHLGVESRDVRTRSTATAAVERADPPRSAATEVTAALGKMPDQGSLTLRLKHAISRARPLLHVILLFAPTVGFLLLAGRGPAFFLAVTLALFIELAQAAFGYGFEWEDVFDLANDAIGIALAIFIYGRIHGHLLRWNPALFNSMSRQEES